MTNKIKILIVDDVDDQITDLINCLFASEGIYKEEVVQLAEQNFEITIMKSVGEAITIIEDNKYRPDIAFCDLNFQQLPPTKYSEFERGNQRGIELVNVLHLVSPETIIVLHTLYIGDSRNIFTKVPPECIYPIHSTFDDLKKDTPEILKKIAHKYFQKLGHDPKKVNHLFSLLKNAKNVEQLLGEKVIIGTNEPYLLRHLLVGWSNIYYEGIPKFAFPDLETIKNTINSFLVADEKLDFNGNFKKQHVLNIVTAYLAHPNHDIWMAEIRKDVLDILSEVVTLWDKRYVGPKIIQNNTLINIHSNLRSIVNGSTSLDEDTLDTLQRILKCRLIIASICHLKQIDKGRKFLNWHSISTEHIVDFAILAVIRNKDSDFEKQTKIPDTHRSVIKDIFINQLSLKGSLKVQTVDASCLLKEEKVFLTDLVDRIK